METSCAQEFKRLIKSGISRRKAHPIQYSRRPEPVLAAIAKLGFADESERMVSFLVIGLGQPV
jgi:hypothetical protein